MKKETNVQSFREDARHGDVFLPINSYHSVIPGSYGEVALHWHEEMEITLIQKGFSDYRVGGETFRAEEGDLILVQPYCTHSASEIQGVTMVSDSLVFGVALLGAGGQDLAAIKYLRPLSEGQLIIPAKIRKNDEGYREMKSTFLKVLKCFREKTPLYELKLKEHLLHLIISMYENNIIQIPEEKESTLIGRQQLKNVLQYIAEHCSEQLSIARLAGISGFSESYFMSLFNKNVGMSCIQYINHCRILNAAKELEDTSRPVMDIAMDNGFSNMSYFNMLFRRFFDMTPREFRKSISGK